MDTKVVDVWKDNLKAGFSKIATLNNWLAVLVLTVIFTFFQQYSELRNQKTELAKCDFVIEHRPWKQLKRFYEESNGRIDDYYTSHAMPWYKLSVATTFGITAFKEFLPDSSKNKLTGIVNEISFSARALGPYISDLTKVISAQKNSKSFDNLGREELVSLINIFNFDRIAKQDSFKFGINKTDTFAIAFETPRLQKIITVNKPMTNTLRTILQFAENAPFFRTFLSDAYINDIIYFGDYQKLQLSFESLKQFIENDTTFESLDPVKVRRNKIKDKIADIETGNQIDIPLIKKSVSLVQFVILGGIINLIIVLYLLSVVRQTRFAWSIYSVALAESTADYISAYFHNWTYGINRYLFVLLYSLFLSSITLVSLIFALLINTVSKFGISRIDFFVIIAFAIVNFIFAGVASNIYLNLNKTQKR